MEKFKKIQTLSDMQACFSVMKELRTHLSFDEFMYLTNQAKEHDDYQLVGYLENDKCLAVMGYRILFDLVHGKHLYIDDLVVTSKLRSKGIGAALLKLAEETATKLNCKTLRLCTGVDNEAGKRFYEKNHWKFRAIVYKKNA